jgi:hypothetical protein
MTIDDPSDYESATTDTSESAATVKYYQITVQNHLEVPSPVTLPAASSDGVTIPTFVGASSFLRIGSSPESSDWTSAVFGSSAKLAKLVGDPTSIQAAETGINDASGTGGFEDGSGRTAPYGNAGDSNYLLGFTDDTRSRNPDSPSTTLVNNTAVENTSVNRQSETLRLLTKGGWWDHSDGNRISTTAGDKVEVIQGNYKMVVLGRQSPTTSPGELVGNALITDVSGGHFEEQYTSPTPAIKTVEWKVEDGRWTVYQDNGEGNVITKFKGTTVDLYQGPRRETLVGSEPASGALREVDDALDPVLISKTWAQRIETYVGSVAKSVPHIKNETYAHEIQNYTFAASIVNTTMATSIVGFNGAANNLDMALGIKESIALGAVLDIFIGPKMSISVDEWQYANMKNVVSVQAAAAIAMESRLTGISTSVGNLQTSIVNSSNRISQACNEVASSHTVLGEAVQCIALTFDALAADVSLGV